MRIEKFMDLAVAIVNDNLAIWFRSRSWRKNHPRGEWVFLRANENGKSWIKDYEFEETHPGILDDILRRLNNG